MSSCEFDEDYFERGVEMGKSLYSNYRWMPELTIPLASTLCEQLGIPEGTRVLDFGCAKGYLVYALRLLGREAYGVDISRYALAECPKEVYSYLRYSLDGLNQRSFDWIIAKDVLEHIPEDKVTELLRDLRNIGKNCWAAIPLGEDGKYIIPAYELDKTHKIRRSLEWWSGRFVDAGWMVMSAKTSMPHVKENWLQHRYGNGFFVCE